MSSSSTTSDWKNKYLDALDEQERRDRRHQQLTALMVKALMRISLVSEGMDTQLDKQMAGLRQLFHDGLPSGQAFNTIVEALEGQVKRLDVVKSERAKATVQGFRELVDQLQNLKPETSDAKQLKQFAKTIDQRSQRAQDYSVLVSEFAKLQGQVLDVSKVGRLSKPFWHQWLSNSDDTTNSQTVAPASADIAVEDTTPKDTAQEITAPKKMGENLSSLPAKEHEEKTYQSIDLANDEDLPTEDVSADSVGEEPPFARLNRAVCAVLQELLDQIEPPALAKENYQTAQRQISKGLNWYELVPTLEDVSIVVLSAFDQNQKEFEAFLSQLNGRLEEAFLFISSSGELQGQGFAAGQVLSESISEQVSAMQQSINDATELDQLKSEVNNRLDTIVSAMDGFQTGEQQREVSLSEQLDSLVDRVKYMEQASEQAEERIEEQRQKALRDMLTQLPNREAYQQRLGQESERWQRYQRPLSMVVCDIDHFKKINDNYGHLAGDKVLRIIAKTLRKRLRKTDFVARYGGEEFVVLMPETAKEQALKVIEGVREAIATCPFHFKDQRVSITMSFGVTDFVGEDNGEGVFARADKAMYQAKEQGRNTSVLATVE
ncbi:MAG: diguanylate cyclase [Pseudohongiellaceae bacterium]|jgi:diguanylate cyclase